MMETQSRTPPEDLSAEQATLGCCLLSEAAMQHVAAVLVPADFYREAHRIVFAAFLAVMRSRPPVDIVSAGSELRRLGQLEAVGGGQYLTALIGEVPSASHVARYAQAVERASLARQVIQHAAAMQDAAYLNPEDPAELLGATIHELETLRERHLSGGEPVLVASAHQEDEARMEARRLRPYAVSPARFGIADLDDRTGGLEDAGFCVIKGDTNVGKSGVLRQIAIATAQVLPKGEAVLLFALEESRWRWRMRSLGWLGGFDTRAFRNAHKWAEVQKTVPDLDDRYSEANVKFSMLPLLIADQDLSMGQIEAHAKHMAGKYRLRAVIIDYLQKVGQSGEFRNEEQEFRQIAKRCARLRDSVGCPIIGASQITKAADGTIHTFGARAFEHEADTRIEIFRDRNEQKEWEAECTIQISKTRELEPCRVQVYTDFATGRWTDLATRERERQAQQHQGAQRVRREW
jgi:replicative DNA helicase